MPAGLQLASRLPEPLFTPSTKATEGHDLNIDFAAAVDLVGREAARRRGTSASSSTGARRRAAPSAGLVLADTKFELGYVDGMLSLCDEVCTPDSSRLWPADQVVPGHDPARLRQAAAARLAGRAALGPHAAAASAALRGDLGHVRRYVAAYERVTGRSLGDWYGATA